MRWPIPRAPQSGVRVAWVEDLDDLLALGTAWDGLAERPYDTLAWIGPWWRAFGGGAGLRVATAHRDGVLVAGIVLQERGRTLTAAANEHTPVTGPVGAARDVDGLLRAVLEQVGVLDLRPAPAAPPEGPAGYLRSVSRWSAAPWVRTEGTFDAWRAASRPRWGAPLERFARKMARERALRLAVNEVPDPLPAALDRGFAVEAGGWKGRAGTAITSSPVTERFYRDLAESFAARDGLLVSELRLDGRLAAWDLSIRHHGRVHLLKTGFDERFRPMAPGLVLRLEVIRACFEDPGVVAHELEPDPSPWKLKFATDVRPVQRWRCYAQRPLPAARYAVGGSARRLRRRWRP